MALPNPSMSFTPFDPLPASDLNDLVENIESLADGTGFDAASIGAVSIDFGGAGSGIWWEEIGRTTLESAGDTITVDSIAAKKYLKIVYYLPNTGATSVYLNFNNDTGNNYSARRLDGTTNTSNTGLGQLRLDADADATQKSGFIEMNNAETTPKAGVGASTGTAGSLPSIKSIAIVWDNTASQITRVDITNPSAGSFAAGSEVIVLGHD